MTASSIPSPSPVPQAEPGHAFGNRYFRMLLFGSTISLLGDQFYLVALPWLILSLTSSSVALGTIMMMAAVPRVVFMLIGGAVSDLMSPRKIMIVTAWTRTVFVGAVGLLIWLHAIKVWQLYILALAFGVADAFSLPASRTLLPGLLDPRQLPAANSINQTTAQLTTIVGPSPAGLIVKAFGLASAFFIDAFSFLFIIAALWKIPDPPRSSSPGPKKGMWRSILEGLRYAARDQALRSLLVITAALNFCVGGTIAVGLPWMTMHRFGTPVAFSICVSAVAAGGLVGALLAGIYKSKQRGKLFIAVSCAIALCMGCLGWIHHLWLMSADFLVMGLAAGLLNVQLISWFQQKVQRDMLGRLMSVVTFAALGLQPLSLLTAGFLVKWGVIPMFVSAGGLMLLVTLFAALHKPVWQIE
jgi:MFS family permease